MVGMILKLNQPLTQDDAADAVAIAICAAESSSYFHSQNNVNEFL